MVNQPAGTVSFFFSDIEGSTRLLQLLGETRYAECLDEHRAVIRRSFAAHGGYEVKTQGDSFFGAFSTASDAVQAAADVTRELAEHAWPEGAEIRVRIGLHTGVPLVAPPDYVGVDVHRAARIMAAAHGGQVLVSDPTRRLLTDRFELRDLGEHRLKDLRAPERLYQLVVDGEWRQFPPLRTLEGRRTNLPAPVSDFIGRTREVVDVVRLIRHEGRRLVTLTGVGGVGKTRLGWRAASELVDDFPDGVVQVSLSSLRDPELVVPEIGHALELLEDDIAVDEGTLTGEIGDQKLLLLLDSFDRVRSAAGMVVRLLHACPRLVVLATTRAPLGVEEEVVYPVPPLDAADARDLLVSRARAHGAALEQADPALSAIVDRVDRLPLALELAAARLRLLQPAELVTKIEEAVFESGRLAYAPTRQQTIRSMIDWSYELMSPGEQQLFARLSVFTAAAPLRALEQICGADLETLSLLLDTGFVRRLESSDGVARFVLPDLVRAYARECLAGCGEEADIARAHARYYLDYARDLMAGAAPPPDAEAEQGNFWSAVEWAHANDPELAREVGAALVELFRARGQTVAERSVSAVIDREMLEGAERERERRAATAAIDRGRELLHNGDFTEAARHLEEVLQEAQRTRSDRHTARASAYLALAELYRNRHGRALRALVTSLRLIEEGGADDVGSACFEGFAAVAAAAGDKVHAARMQGAASGLAGRDEQVVASLRSATRRVLVQALGVREYEHAVAAGAALSFAEAAAEARAGRQLAPSG
jgi:predicted ATPase/class 3 adenylate cyclase